MSKSITSIIPLAAVAAPVPSQGQAQTPECPFGPNWETIGIYALAMDRPFVGNTEIVSEISSAAEDTVLARQTVRLQPKIRYLATDAVLSGPDGEKLGQAIPLAKGSLITSWRMGAQSRDCSIGWKNGLFGGAAGDGHYRWICFEDRDSDGAFDHAFRTQTRNMGLSYSEVAIPLASPVRTSEARAPANPPKNTAALGVHELERTLSVRKVKKGVIHLRLNGLTRRDREDAELALEPGRSAAIGGLTVTVMSGGEGAPSLQTTGAFTAPDIAPVCEGTYYAVNGLSTQVTFSFPNW